MRPPPGSVGIDQMLPNARTKLDRITLEDVRHELRYHEGTSAIAAGFLVDVGSEAQRRKLGGVCGALAIERSVLERRLDPRECARLSIADRYALRVAMFYQLGVYVEVRFCSVV